jgi:hypothetical protein
MGSRQDIERKRQNSIIIRDLWAKEVVFSDTGYSVHSEDLPLGSLFRLPNYPGLMATLVKKTKKKLYFRLSNGGKYECFYITKDNAVRVA